MSFYIPQLQLNYFWHMFESEWRAIGLMPIMHVTNTLHSLRSFVILHQTSLLRMISRLTTARRLKNGSFFFVLGAHQRGKMSLSLNEVFFSFNRNTKNTTYKSRQTLLTIPLTIGYLHNIQYNTSLDYNYYNTFYRLFFGYTPMYLANCNSKRVSTQPLTSSYYYTQQQYDFQFHIFF